MEFGICAHAPGRVGRIEVEVGDKISEGQTCVVLEAMSVEMPVPVAMSGRVKRIDCAVGQAVSEDEVLFILEGGAKKPARKRARKKKIKPVDFDDIKAPAGSQKVTKKDLDALEAEYGELPRLYRELVTRFGAGEYRGTLGVCGPAQVRKWTTQWRVEFFGKQLLDFKDHVRLPTLKALLWANVNDVLSPDDVPKLVVLALASAGDLATITFVSGEPERLLRFPRPGRLGLEVEEVGPTFAHAIAKYFEDDDDDDE
jgi:hypothetical protein